jgi:peptide/nickel transport system ATP-binding protein
MSKLVELNNVSKTFDVSLPWLNRVLEGKGRQLLHAVSDVTFSIERGETLALVGESGCGKSTVARVICGLYAPTGGEVRFDGEALRSVSKDDALARAQRRRVQMIFQDPYASLNPRWRVKDIVSEPIRVHKLVDGEANIEKRGVADGEKFPHQFSGGQRQRISIARALASQPEFLVCDEPTSALDVSVQAQVLNLMKELQRELKLTYLFISHNLAVVHHIADRVGVMYLGRVVELAPKAELFKNPKHPYTRMLLDAIPDLQMTGRARTPVAGEVPNPLNPPSGCTFHPRCPQATEACKTSIPPLKSIGSRLLACPISEI